MPALDRARAELENGIKLVAERQKLIKLANPSDYGWEVVSEYTTDVLAENSDNEKRIDREGRRGEGDQEESNKACQCKAATISTIARDTSRSCCRSY